MMLVLVAPLVEKMVLQEKAVAVAAALFLVPQRREQGDMVVPVLL